MGGEGQGGVRGVSRWLSLTISTPSSLLSVSRLFLHFPVSLPTLVGQALRGPCEGGCD